MTRAFRFIRAVALLVIVTFLFGSCTKTVVVPLGPIDRPEQGKTYVVYLKDGSHHTTKNLHMEIDDSLTFTSLNQSYHVRPDEVQRVERIDMDTDRTIIAVSVVAALVVTAFYFLGKAISGSGLGAD